MKPTEAIRSVEGNGKVLRLFNCRFLDRKWNNDKQKDGYLIVLTTEKEEADLPEYKDKKNKSKIKRMRERFKKDKKKELFFKDFIKAEDKYISMAEKQLGVKEELWVAGKNFP